MSIKIEATSRLSSATKIENASNSELSDRHIENIAMNLAMMQNALEASKKYLSTGDVNTLKVVMKTIISTAQNVLKDL